MKKTLFTAIIALFAAGMAFGQLSLRPQVGINFASFTEEVRSFEFEGNVGFQFGADLQIGNTFYVQPGANFQTKKLTLQSVGDLQTSRLNIPIMLGFKLFEPEGGKAFGARIFAGPNFAFNVGEDLEDAFTDVSITGDDIRSFQLSAIVGAGLDISILFVDLGYKIGLTDFFEDDSNLDGSLNLFIVNAGIRIGF